MFIWFLNTECLYGENRLPKRFKAFRFSPELYEKFKELVSTSGYTMTGAIEKFMHLSVENGALAFPAPKTTDYEAEARILLDWRNKGEHWYTRGSEDEGEISIRGRLLTLLPLISSTELKAQIEKALT